MNGLDDIAFDGAKQISFAELMRTAVADDRPVSVDFGAIVKEMMLRSNHPRPRCPVASWSESGTGRRAETGL